MRARDGLHNCGGSACAGMLRQRRHPPQACSELAHSALERSFAGLMLLPPQAPPHQGVARLAAAPGPGQGDGARALLQEARARSAALHRGNHAAGGSEDGVLASALSFLEPAGLLLLLLPDVYTICYVCVRGKGGGQRITDTQQS
jgi:hypothetical protein